MQEYSISKEEDGQKILQCLKRKFDIPTTLLHKLLRKGIIRKNGKRSKAFDTVFQNDIIKIPTSLENTCRLINSSSSHSIKEYIFFEDENILAINKPAGLPVHNGTRHSDSVMSRVEYEFQKLSFIPTIAHRLDKDTSGILILAKNYRTLSYLHEQWREHRVQKYYFAWVRGIWKNTQPILLQDTLIKKEKGVSLGEGTEVSLTVTPHKFNKNSSLLHILLHTGKTHQIRIQLASRNFPLLGENKYAKNNKKISPLYLHATEIRFPNGLHLSLPPLHWTGLYSTRQE
ncbi:MAG: RluA family pseudouridine synthase [Desulfovibrionaceae bacterium]